MGWSVPVLEKGSWAMAQVFISVGTWRYNYNLQPLQSLRPTLPSLLDWLSDVGACITLDIHILRSCSETSLLIHCKVPLIADICKLILQTYQTSDNHSLHASHFSSWSLFFSTQCCYCAKTLSAAAYREVWIHSNQQHNGPMCWHLASCESRAKQEGLWPCQCDSMNLEHIHCGKPNNLHLRTVTPNTSSENHFLKTLFSMLCKNWRQNGCTILPWTSFLCLSALISSLLVMPPAWGTGWLACGKSRQFLRIFPIPEPQPLFKQLRWCLSYLELQSCIVDVF